MLLRLPQEKVQEGPQLEDEAKRVPSYVQPFTYIVSAEEIRMEPTKTQAIEDWETLENVRGVRAFLGFGNLYRLFGLHYSDLADPLSLLTGKDVGFDEPADGLHSHPGLVGFGSNSEEVILETDASRDPILARCQRDPQTRDPALGDFVGGREELTNPQQRALCDPQTMEALPWWTNRRGLRLFELGPLPGP